MSQPFQFPQRVDQVSDVTPESIARARAAQWAERRAVELATGGVFVGDRLTLPQLESDVTLRLMNVTHAAIHQVLYWVDGPLDTQRRRSS